MEYFLLFLIWIAAAFFFPVMLRRFQIPWVTAVIFAGIIIGPNGLGIVNSGEVMDFLATIGLVFLMFTAGMDIKFSKLKISPRKTKKNVFTKKVIPSCIVLIFFKVSRECFVTSVVLILSFIMTLRKFPTVKLKISTAIAPFASTLSIRVYRIKAIPRVAT